MNTSYPNDDQQSLPLWATITQVSDLLGIPYNAVRSAVRRAAQSGKQWVKKETFEDGTLPVYLIDTDHEDYQAHAKRWKRTVARNAAWSKAVERARNAWEFSELPEQPSWFPPLSATKPHNTSEQKPADLHSLPGLCRWLYAHNLHIFTNILAEERREHPWQWRWGDLDGEGYGSEEEALIAALQCRHDANEREKEALVSTLQSWCDANEREKEEEAQFATTHPPSGPQDEASRFWFFGRRTGSSIS